MRNLDCLQKETKEVLENLMTLPNLLCNYVLVGGSALAIQTCHRLSEDLDFFTFSDSFNRDIILKNLESFNEFQITNETKEQFDITINNIKVTFFNSKWDFLRPNQIEKLNVCPIEVISAMKVNVLFSRAKYRDYYDLYYIVKYFLTLEQIYNVSKYIINGLNFKLFTTALLYLDDIEEDNISHLSPKENISKEEIADFFKNEIKKLN